LIISADRARVAKPAGVSPGIDQSCIDGLRNLQQLFGLMDAKDRLFEKVQHISNQMDALKRLVNNPKTTHSEWLQSAKEYHSKAQELIAAAYS
jgi:hypothetical protein